jgi:DNA-binding MarR family transcriptional regulator
MHARTKFYLDAIERRIKKTPGVPKQATMALYHIAATHDLLHAHFTPIAAKYGVSLAGWNLINLLNATEEGARPMHELSQLMLVSRQNVTQLVDGLEKKKLVQRHASREDGRVKFVEITKAGRELAERGQRAHLDAIRDVFAKLRDPELERLADFLVRIQERVLEHKEEKEAVLPETKRRPRGDRPAKRRRDAA